MKLTTAIARNLELPPGKTDHLEFDDDFPGFGVRIRAGRKRVRRMWIYQYDIGGRSRRATLGNVNAIGIEAARKAAGQLQGEVRLGRDPVTEKAESRARVAHTFATVMQNYLAIAKVKTRPTTWKVTKYHLEVTSKDLHPLPFASITRRDIATVLAPITARGTLQLCNNTRSKLSAFFNWAVTEGLIEHNPVAGTIRHARPARDRALSLPELAAVWHALDTIPINICGWTEFTNIVRLLMLTGQRRTEISDLLWGEIHDEKSFFDEGRAVTGPAIVLPPERTKTNRKHIVPLSEPAQTILRTRTRGRDDEFVIRRKAKLGWTAHKAALDMELIRSGHTLAPWVFHDLRRSVATGMGEIGISTEVIEAALNHVSGTCAGIAGVYNRSKLEEPKRQALAAWAEVLMAQVEGRVRADKVVPLRP